MTEGIIKVLKANFHTHSTFCDGISTPRESVERAIELGFITLGFSGHVDIEPVMDAEAYKKELRAIQEEYKDEIEILCGGELDNMYHEKHPQGYDYIIGSTHHLKILPDRFLAVDSSEEDLQFLCDNFFNGDYYKLIRYYYELVSRTHDETNCTFIGHFDLVTKFNSKMHFVDEDDKRYYFPAMEAMEYIVKSGMPYFEINTRQVSKGRIYPSKRLLSYLHELGGEILISSDAHDAHDLNKGFDQAVELAKSCGFDHTNYLSMKSGKLEFVPTEI